MLTNEESPMRQQAVHALGKIGEPAVLDVIKALTNENSSVRLSAVDALGDIGSAAVPFLC